MQRSFNVLLLTSDKLSKNNVQKRSHDVKTNVETTFLKRFCAGWACFPCFPVNIANYLRTPILRLAAFDIIL